ncbi:MAG TPA: hypothetical protein VGE37_13770 [Archangium sp.]
MNAHRARDPQNAGKALLRFTILLTGKAEVDAGVSEGPPELVACLLRVVERTEFPVHRQPSGPITWPVAF